MPSITPLDMVLAAVMLISGFLAMLRGITREILSIASWVAAAGAAWYAYSNYQDEIKQLVPVQPEIAAVIGVVAVVFLIVLIIVSLLTIKIGDRVLDSSIGALDRTFGLLFGLARGLILVGIVFWFFLKFTADERRPPFIENAYSRDLIMWTSDGLESIGRKIAEKVNGKLSKGGDAAAEDQP